MRPLSHWGCQSEASPSIDICWVAFYCLSQMIIEELDSCMVAICKANAQKPVFCQKREQIKLYRFWLGKNRIGNREGTWWLLSHQALLLSYTALKRLAGQRCYVSSVDGIVEITASPDPFFFAANGELSLYKSMQVCYMKSWRYKYNGESNLQL